MESTPNSIFSLFQRLSNYPITSFSVTIKISKIILDHKKRLFSLGLALWCVRVQQVYINHLGLLCKPRATHYSKATGKACYLQAQAVESQPKKLHAFSLSINLGGFLSTWVPPCLPLLLACQEVPFLTPCKGSTRQFSWDGFVGVGSGSKPTFVPSSCLTWWNWHHSQRTPRKAMAAQLRPFFPITCR